MSLVDLPPQGAAGLDAGAASGNDVMCAAVCAGCGEKFTRRKGHTSKFCSLDCGVNHRSRSDHTCPDCGTPQTPVDAEKHGCIVRTWRCGRCGQSPEGGAEEAPVPDVTETQIECGSTAKGHGFGCPTHHDGLNCFRCAWECTECGVSLLDWFQYEKTRPRAGEAAD
ncbi:MAG: hypothetical protein J4F28_02115 [Nitrosopumilaceae archaeon]|nr:hypothetical protein [Nitrosopumilaceae archaeon]